MEFSKEHRENLRKSAIEYRNKQLTEMLERGTKRCTICKEEKSLAEFSRLKKGKENRFSWCKSCQSIRFKAWSSTPEAKAKGRARRAKRYNTEKRRLASRDLKLRRRKEWAEFLIKNNLHKCSICGYDKNAAALDYHHINKEEKKLNISSHIYGKITEKFLEEIKKVVCVCTRCHREIHHPSYGSVESFLNQERQCVQKRLEEGEQSESQESGEKPLF